MLGPSLGNRSTGRDLLPIIRPGERMVPCETFALGMSAFSEPPSPEEHAVRFQGRKRS